MRLGSTDNSLGVTDALFAWRATLESLDGSETWTGWITSAECFTVLVECVGEVPGPGLPLRMVIEKFGLAEVYDVRSQLVSDNVVSIKVVKKKGSRICQCEGRRRTDPRQVVVKGAESTLPIDILDAGAGGVGFSCVKELPPRASFPLALCVNGQTLRAMAKVVHQRKTDSGEYRGGLRIEFTDRLDHGTWVKFIETMKVPRETRPGLRESLFSDGESKQSA